MTTIYLVRHAEAQGNIDRCFQGHYDGKISKNGDKQLLCLRKRFKKIEINAIYSSPLQRAVATAEAVNYYAELPVILDSSLMEICGGAFEQKKYADLPELFPEEWEQWDNEPHKFQAPGGESMRHCYDRMKTTLNRIVHANMGRNIAIISHGCALRNYLCYITKTPFELLDSIPWGDNTCVSRIDFDDKFKAKIVYMNNVSHLPEDLSTLAKQNWWRKDNDLIEAEESAKMLHIDAGELYVKDDDMQIASGDLFTPQGPVPLNNVRLHVAEGTVFIRDNDIRLTDPPEKDIPTVTIEDEILSEELPLEELEELEELEPLSDEFTEEEFTHIPA